MNGQPTVSVVIPCFNGEVYLAEAIESVLDQSYPNAEVVVVDDGSTDGSYQVMESYLPRVTIVRQENRGLPAARNAGIAASTGDYLAFLDADDYWDSTFIEKMVAALRGTPSGLAYCGWQNVGLPGGRGRPFVPPEYEGDDKLGQFLKFSALWPVHAALVPRTLLEQTGWFDEALTACEDYDFWLRLAHVATLVRVPEVLAYYRHHGEGQMTSKQWIQARNNWFIKKRFIASHPEITRMFSREQISEFLAAALMRRGYDCYWKRDLVSAQKIFRMAVWTSSWKLGDLKYIVPALLPAGVYRRVVTSVDRRAEAR